MPFNSGKVDHKKRLMQPLFSVPKKETIDTVIGLDSEASFYREAAARSGEDYRLVKRGESPTTRFRRIFEANKHRGSKQFQEFQQRARINQLEGEAYREHHANLHTCPEPLSLESRKTIKLSEYISTIPRPDAITKESKAVVRLYSQDWSGKYRFGFESGAMGARVLPPEITGERQTDELTKNATRKILESGAYMSACRGGYTTFLTLTFDSEARERIANGDTTIGKEVSRFFDAAQKMYRRGMRVKYWENEDGELVDYEGHGHKLVFSLPMVCPELVYPRLPTGEIKEIPTLEECEPYNYRKHITPDYLEQDAVYGHKIMGAPLDYMWVAEAPINDDGEQNPHVHVMMRWSVEKKHFKAWAERLEDVWGHGFANLKRIHTPEAAGNYLIKAVGYLTKGSKQDQGMIKGNRYNISASARAPKWECVGEFYADNFLAILGELREKLHRKKAKIRGSIHATAETQTDLKAKYKKLCNIQEKEPSNKRQNVIDKLKMQLEQNDKFIKSTQSELGSMPFINDFAIGNMSEDQASDFLSWAMRDRWWNCEVKEHKYSNWSELRANTVEAIKKARSHWRGAEWLIETRELSWQWARNDSKFEIVNDRQDVVLDENGHEWERVSYG